MDADTKIQLGLRTPDSREEDIAPSNVSNEVLDQVAASLENGKTTNNNAAPDIPYSAFSTSEKRAIVFLVALAGFFSPFSAFIYFPALQDIANDLYVSLELMNLTVTLYLVVQGIVPSLFGDMAETLGRRPVYLLAFLIYVLASVGLALQDSYPALIILRMVQSAGSSGIWFHPISIHVNVMNSLCGYRYNCPCIWSDRRYCGSLRTRRLCRGRPCRVSYTSDGTQCGFQLNESPQFQLRSKPRTCPWRCSGRSAGLEMDFPFSCHTVRSMLDDHVHQLSRNCPNTGRER